MSSRGITVDNLLSSLPDVLKSNDDILALATVIAEALTMRAGETNMLEIFPLIDELPEQLLDLLAYDFKIDWWDGDYTLDEKRQLFHDHWKIHRKLGTKAAVEQAISVLYPDTEVEEWFNYDGTPYHFRLLINITYEGIDPERHNRVMQRIKYYKNLRSVLDEVEYYDAGGTATGFAGIAVVGESVVDTCTVKNYTGG